MAPKKGVYKCHGCGNNKFRDNSDLRRHVEACKAFRSEGHALHQNDIAEMVETVKEQNIQIKTLMKASDAQKKTIQSLKKASMEKEKRDAKMEATIAALSERIEETNVSCDQERKKERFYQEWLAEELDGSHKTVEVGITDISNRFFDMEIKTFKKWKDGLRQIHAYNECTSTGNKILVLFDIEEGDHPGKIIAACEKFKTRLIFVGSDKSFKNVSPYNVVLGDDWRSDINALKELVCSSPYLS